MDESRETTIAAITPFAAGTGWLDISIVEEDLFYLLGRSSQGVTINRIRLDQPNPASMQLADSNPDDFFETFASDGERVIGLTIDGALWSVNRFGGQLEQLGYLPAGSRILGHYDRYFIVASEDSNDEHHLVAFDFDTEERIEITDQLAGNLFLARTRQDGPWLYLNAGDGTAFLLRFGDQYYDLFPSSSSTFPCGAENNVYYLLDGAQVRSYVPGAQETEFVMELPDRTGSCIGIVEGEIFYIDAAGEGNQIVGVSLVDGSQRVVVYQPESWILASTIWDGAVVWYEVETGRFVRTPL
jgi:hypothetical protein